MEMAALIGLGAMASPGRAQSQPKRVRLLLNTSFSGPQAWFLLAEDLGLFRREGLQVGSGSRSESIIRDNRQTAKSAPAPALAPGG